MVKKEDKQVTKLSIGLIVSWVFGIIFGLGGFSAILLQGPAYFGFGVVGILIALVILPPANRFYKEKLNFELSRNLKILAVVILMVIASSVAPYSNASSPDTVVGKTQNVEQNIASGGVFLKGEPAVTDAGISGSYYMTGEILNNGTQSYRNYQISAVASLYQGGKIVGSCSGFAETDLGPGDTSTYKVICFNVPEFNSYKVRLQIS